MMFSGAPVRTQRRSLQLAPAPSSAPACGPAATELPSRTHKPCLTVEEALKESDREHYLRLVEMVSEKYSKAKPLPFAQTKPYMSSLQGESYKQTVIGRTGDTKSSKPTPLRANVNVFGWRDGLSVKQAKDRTLDMGLAKSVADCKSVEVAEQKAWRGKAQRVELDLSEEVAARLHLKEKVPGPVSVPIGLQSRAPVLFETRQADEELPRLTKAMQEEVSAALAQKDPNLVVSSAFKLRITQRDLATLQEGSWLNDEVINFYLNLLMSRSELHQQAGGACRRVYSFSTFFFPKLHGGGHAAVRRWTKSVDLFTFDLILVPLHLGVHWSLAVVDLKAKSVRSYDSMGQRHDDICNLILMYLREEMKVKKDKDLDVTKWSVNSLKASEIPQQRNSNDCGVFACKYADYISRGRALTFRQCHMPLFRKLMIWEILHQRLL